MTFFYGHKSPVLFRVNLQLTMSFVFTAKHVSREIPFNRIFVRFAGRKAVHGDPQNEIIRRVLYPSNVRNKETPTGTWRPDVARAGAVFHRSEAFCSSQDIMSDMLEWQGNGQLTRSHVDGGTSAEVVHHALIGSQTKVGEVDLRTILASEDVLRLEVTVDDAPRM